MQFPSLFGFVALVALAFGTGNGEFDWDTITPSWDLEYHACYTTYLCARLLLPLNWLDETDARTVTIAITKSAAVVDESDARFGGTIFTQPGGPGASGTSYIRNRGELLRNFTDIPGKKHYELLAFDPRGVGMSLPRINCFPGFLGLNRLAEAAGTGSGPASLPFLIAAARADYQQCERIHGDTLSYVGTPNVARDMLAIVDKIDERRRRGEASARQDPKAELRSLHEEAAKPRLQYIGVSYGTELGIYFASLYPGRVGRMVLDGISDPYDSTHGIGGLRNTQDTDKIADIFFQGCFDAGYPICALYRESDTSWRQVKHRFWSWAEELDEQPLFDVSDVGVRIFIRSDDIRMLFLMALYNAVFVFQALASDFDQAMRGNTKQLFQRMAEVTAPRDPKTVCSNQLMETPLPFDPFRAVICVDGASVTDLELSEWREYYEKQMSISTLAGSLWSSFRMSCAGWRARPNWRFKGPFTTPEPSETVESPTSGRPAAPILVLSNRWDLVTPLQNARAILKNHPGAQLVVQESIGHCAILNAVGPCLRGLVAEYFDTGKVPSGEVTCEPAHGPWDT